jgi:hypothetical protein
MTVLVTLSGVFGVSTPVAIAADIAGGWEFAMEPYLWTPVIEAGLKFSTPSGSSGAPEVKVEPNEYLENLDFAFIAAAEARKGKWSFTADFVYMELSDSGSRVRSVDFGGSLISTELDAGSEVDMKSFITTFGGGYQVVYTQWLNMDLVAGLRYLWLESRVDWRLSGDITGPGPGQTFLRYGSHTENGDLGNGVCGIRGRLLFGRSPWFIPFYGDVGTGDSDLTWQLYAALGYSFKDWVDAIIGYRYIGFDNGGDDFIQDLRLYGPVIGARFTF